MKDEEMAEQYAQNLEKELMKEYEEHSEYGQTAYLATIPTPHAKQAFLAGLKAGRQDDQLTKAKRLLMFWVNDFYDNFNHSNKYEERHKALVETEQFIKEIEK